MPLSTLRSLKSLVAAASVAAGPAWASAQRAPATPATGRFDADLFRAVVSSSPKGNVFISPVSASVALAMAYEGASGPTRMAIARVLGAPDDGESLATDMAARMRALTSDRETTVSVANSLWARADAPIEPDYAGRMKSVFGAEVVAVDLTSPATVARINAWVSRATRGRIDQMLSQPLGNDDVAVLLNAVYFKGSWKDAFEPGSTRPRPFHTGAGTTQNRPAMTRVGEYAYAHGAGVAALRIPYRGGRFAMYVLLPDSTTPLDSITALLEPARSATWMAALATREVRLQLPKFRLDYQVDLVGPLTRLGMGIAFDRRQASFSRMLPAGYLARRNAFIDRVAQKTFVVVNEEGTEAAASTMIAVMVDSADARPVPFIVDRPFVFLIREESTGTVLFVGRIVDPR